MFRYVVFLVCFLLSSASVVYAASYDAEVPVTVDDNVDVFDTGTEIFSTFSDDERNTCDPEFWDVIKDRAWMEAQREITQNWNVIPRPDSVMALGCFNRHLNDLATYGDDHFPYSPDHSDGQLAEGVFNQLAIQLAKTRFSITFSFSPQIDFDGLGYETLLLGSDLLVGNGGDAVLTGGIAPYALLELLVLDQLVEDVSPCGALVDTVNYPAAAAVCIIGSGSSNSAGCAGISLLGDAAYPKNTFLEGNFPDLALGGRAIDRPAATGMSAFSEINSIFDNDVRSNGGGMSGCDTMNRVWRRAQCYDFAMESMRYDEPRRYDNTANLDTSSFPPGLQYGSVEEDHDGFYSLARYRDVADNGEDFRYRAGACEPPDGENDPAALAGDLDLGEFACDILEHGMPFPDFGSFSSFLTTFGAFIPPGDGDSPVWSTAYDGANPGIGDDGAPDEFVDYLELRGGAVPQNPACAPPVKTGYIVVNEAAQAYEDAFCPTPGCWFNPPTAIGSNGTCTQ